MDTYGRRATLPVVKAAAPQVPAHPPARPREQMRDPAYAGVQGPTAKVLIGYDYWASEKGSEVPIYWDETRVINHHIGVAGTSGSGKTHWIKKLVAAMPESVQVDVFDYHGDIDVANATTVRFSEQTCFGYNPLVINPDPDYGGLRRAVMDMCSIISGTSSTMGATQNYVLQNLLYDAYSNYGITQNNVNSWRREVLSVREMHEAHRQYGDSFIFRNCYPTLQYVIHIATKKLKALWTGVEDDGNTGGPAAMRAFEEYCRGMQALNRAKTKDAQVSNVLSQDVDKLTKAVEKAKERARSAHEAYLNSISTGREFQEVIKYNSKEVLFSVIRRLENLVAVGIFNQNPPPFGAARIRRFDLKPLAQSEDELKLFIKFRLRSIIREEMQNGESGGRLRRLIVLDEAKKFSEDDDKRNPLDVIANEMRKFGVGLVLASQSPAHFSEDFIKTSATLLLLNLSTNDHDEAARKLKVETSVLKHLRPKTVGAIRTVTAGDVPKFQQVKFPR